MYTTNRFKEVLSFSLTIASLLLAIVFKGTLMYMFGTIACVLGILDLYYIVKIKIDWLRNFFK